MSIESGKDMYQKQCNQRLETQVRVQPEQEPVSKVDPSRKRKKPAKQKPSEDSDLYQKVYTNNKSRRRNKNVRELGDENELGDWVGLQCALMNADWSTVDGRKNNGLDPLMKYWIKPGVAIRGASQIRTQEIFEGDQVPTLALPASFVMQCIEAHAWWRFVTTSRSTPSKCPLDRLFLKRITCRCYNRTKPGCNLDDLDQEHTRVR